MAHTSRLFRVLLPSFNYLILQCNSSLFILDYPLRFSSQRATKTKESCLKNGALKHFLNSKVGQSRLKRAQQTLLKFFLNTSSAIFRKSFLQHTLKSKLNLKCQYLILQMTSFEFPHGFSLKETPQLSPAKQL